MDHIMGKLSNEGLYLLHSIDLESSSILWISLNLYLVTSPSQVGAGSIPASELPSFAHS